MGERFYKIGELSELLNIEQHTLRYLENSLKLKILRDERGDRQYTESDLDTFKLVLQLKNRGLNTTAIRMALENSSEVDNQNEEEQSDKEEIEKLPARGPVVTIEFVEAISAVKRIAEQNETLVEQNRLLEQRIRRLEDKLDRYHRERDQKLDELIQMFKSEPDARNKSWLSRLWNK